MKHLFYTLSLLLFSLSLFSQEKTETKPSSKGDQIATKDIFAPDVIKTPVKETPSGITNEANWDKLPFQAKKVYDKANVITWSSGKLKEVIFLYTKSFRIIDETKGCNLSPETFDIPELNKLRKLDSKVIVVVKSDLCNVQIELISINELEENFKKILLEK